MSLTNKKIAGRKSNMNEGFLKEEADQNVLKNTIQSTSTITTSQLCVPGEHYMNTR